MVTDVAAAVELYLADCAAGLSVASLEFYRWGLARVVKKFRGRRLRSISSVEVSAWLVELRAGELSLVSVHGCYRCLRAFVRWALRRGLLRVDPLLHVRAPSLPDPARSGLQLHQVRQLVQACAGSVYPARDRALVLLLLDTGLRRAEVAAVRVADIDFERRLLTVLCGKGGKVRLVPVSRSVLQLLGVLVGSRGAAPGDRVFGLSKWGIRFVFRRLSVLSGVVVTPHVMRHTFAFLYGGDIEDVRVVLGHSDIRTTSAIYRHRGAVALVKAHDARSPVAML